MADSDKVTLRFETTSVDDGTAYEDIVLSGPVNIFATVDYLGDYSNTLTPTEAELTEYLSVNSLSKTLDSIGNFLAQYSGDVYLTSPVTNEFLYLSSLEEIYTLIVFVKDIRAENSDADSQDHRGAYFRLESVSSELSDRCIWQEILLGTHSHDNLDVINDFAEIIASAKATEEVPEEGLLVQYNADGSFSLSKHPVSLPELPDDVKEKIEELNDYDEQDYILVNGEKVYEPITNEGHHLDAELENLIDAYDYLHLTTTKAAGTCRDIYLALAKAGKSVYLTSDYEISTDSKTALASSLGEIYFELAIQETSFTDSEEEVLHAVYDSVNKIYVLRFPFKSFSIDNDNLFLFVEDELVPRVSNGTINFSVDDFSDSILTIHLKESALDLSENKSHYKVTMLATHNSKGTITGFESGDFEQIFTDKIESNEISLENINEKLTEIYIRNRINVKPDIPHLYLMTDDRGNIVWDNMVAPAQRFFSAQVVITADMIAAAEANGNLLTIEFPEAYFDPFEDFPLLLVGELFAFNEKVEAQDDESVKVTIDIDSSISHITVEENTIVTLIIMKSGAGKSLADEIADKYISKADAVDILSHGKLNLSDYVTKGDLATDYAKKFHTHGEYASVKHNHDERYANYYHTHPELYLAIASLSEGAFSAEEIEAKVNALTDEVKESYKELLDAYDELDSDQIDASAELIKAINDTIEACNERNSTSISTLSLSRKYSLTTALEKALSILDTDTVNDEHVVLENSISVNLVNGPVGGISINKTYDSGTTLQTILRDILDPYYDWDSVVAMLTPSLEKSYIEWYYLSSDDRLVEFDISSITEQDFPRESTAAIYFKILLKNKDGGDCAMLYMSSVDGTYKTQQLDFSYYLDGVITSPITSDGDAKYGYFLYGDAVDLYGIEKLADITVAWNEASIYDSRGIKSTKTDIAAGSIIFTDNAITLNTPDFYYAAVDSDKAITDYPLTSTIYTSGYLNKFGYEDINVITTSENDRLMIILEDNDNIANEKIIDITNNLDITNYFEKYLDEDGTFIGYTVFYYDTTFTTGGSEAITHNLRISSDNDQVTEDIGDVELKSILETLMNRIAALESAGSVMDAEYLIANFVDIVSKQSITGAKTFTSKVKMNSGATFSGEYPTYIGSDAPSDDKQLVTKAYVDSQTLNATIVSI